MSSFRDWIPDDEPQEEQVSDSQEQKSTGFSVENLPDEDLKDLGVNPAEYRKKMLEEYIKEDGKSDEVIKEGE